MAKGFRRRTLASMFCSVVWQVLLLELSEDTVTFSLHILQLYTGVMIFLFKYFSSFFLLLWKRLPTSSPTASTKICALTAVWVRNGCSTFEPGPCAGWTSVSNSMNSSTGFLFPRSWMMSLPAISSDSVGSKPFLVFDTFTLHYSDRYMCCNNWSSSSSMLHDM